MNDAFQRGPSDLMVKSSSKQGGKICGRSEKRPAGCYLINKNGTYMQKYISTYGHNQSRAITSAEAYKKQKEHDVDVFAPLSSADQMCFKVFPVLMKN